MADQAASTSPPSPGAKSERQRVVEAFMAILAEEPIEEIGFPDIAARANISLAALRQLFDSKIAILAAHMKETDRAVLEGVEADMAEEPARERLFDVLMRRLEVLAPHKAAVRSLRDSAARNPGLALALNALSVRSQQWMLAAADIPASGPGGALRAQGLALMFFSVLSTWVKDDDPGLARTMSALDGALGRGERLTGLLDGLFSLPERILRNRPGRRRRDAPRGTIAA